MNSEKEYNKIKLRFDAKTNELIVCNQELDQIIGQLVDCKPDERQSIIDRRRELVNLQGLLEDEQKELKKRCDLAYITMHEEILNKEQAELDKLATIAVNERLEMDRILKEYQHFINSKGRSSQTEEGAAKLIQLETAKAQAMAKSRLARQAAERQKIKVKDAQEALEAAIKSIQG